MRPCDYKPVHGGYPEPTRLELAIKRLTERADVLACVSKYYVTGQGCNELEQDLRLVLEKVR